MIILERLAFIIISIELENMNDQISFSSNRNSMQKFKVVLVGDQNVGKSSIIGRYIRN
jgi:GTPase SAR1 family protein